MASTTAFAQYEESITVARILLDVRVTDLSGKPIRDLAPNDFEVRIDDKPVEMEAADWIDESVPVEVPAEYVGQTPDHGENGGMQLPYLSSGRLFVVFVQTDFARAGAVSRVEGAYHFRPYFEKIIKSLHPDDRVAVFQFDSHLKLRLDFTRDKQQVIQAIRDSIHIDEPPTPPPVTGPSLVPSLDRKAMLKATDTEEALVVVANALRPFPGTKNMLLLGWGVGEYVPARQLVRMKPKWRQTLQALSNARVSIYTFDTTWADYHDLEHGLIAAASQTGGYYMKTQVHGDAVVSRFVNTMSGHYELVLLQPPDLAGGAHSLKVDVRRKGVEVLAPLVWRTRH